MTEQISVLHPSCLPNEAVCLSICEHLFVMRVGSVLNACECNNIKWKTRPWASNNNRTHEKEELTYLHEHTLFTVLPCLLGLPDVAICCTLGASASTLGSPWCWCDRKGCLAGHFAPKIEISDAMARDGDSSSAHLYPRKLRYVNKTSNRKERLHTSFICENAIFQMHPPTRIWILLQMRLQPCVHMTRISKCGQMRFHVNGA
jgi:hypothetical protein